MMPTRTAPSKLSSPYQAVLTLLLIENSSSMSTIWNILRDRYLPSVLRKTQGTCPTRHTFYIETSSLSPGFTVLPQFKIYQGTAHGLEFGHGPRNKITVEKIHTGIDLLTSIATQYHPVALHLIIIAASTPSVNSANADLDHHVSRSSWLRLSERMAQEDINCHLVLKAEEDMWPMRVLFEETLRLRSRLEAPPPSSIESTEAIVRLAGTHANSPCQEDSQTAVPSRPSLRRNSTYPLDSGAAKPCDGYEGTSQSQPEVPSLVAQLQQRHGLTKKKVYGVKPPRAPFFRERDDTPFDPYRRAALPFPAALTDLSLSSPITLTPGGRCAPLSRLDRMARLNHRSPTDTSPRYWNQSASRLSSPENEAISASPPTSTVTKVMHAANYEQPVTPNSTSAVTIELPYGVFPQSDQQFAYTHNIYDREVVDSPSHWPNTQNGYMPQHNYRVVTPSQSYGGGYTSSPPADVYNTTSPDNSPISQQQPLSTSIGSRSSASHRDPINNASPHASPSTSGATCPNPKDDEPFTFDPEYVAATTAMFRQEVLPAYPEYSELANSYGGPSIISSKCCLADGTSSVPGYTLGSIDDYSPLPYIPPNKAGQLYAMKYYNMTRQQRQAAEANGTSLAGASMSEYTHALSHLPLPSYTSGSSSLTGWAG